MASVFTKIIKGELPAHLIAEGQSAVAFLDISPVCIGHTLVVPKMEVDKLFHLPSEEYLALMEFAYHIAQALERSYDCNRVGMTVIGLEVPHAHVHLLPISTMDDMNFTRPKLKLSEEELKEAALRIRGNLEPGKWKS